MVWEQFRLPIPPHPISTQHSSMCLFCHNFDHDLVMTKQKEVLLECFGRPSFALETLSCNNSVHGHLLEYAPVFNVHNFRVGCDFRLKSPIFDIVQHT